MTLTLRHSSVPLPPLLNPKVNHRLHSRVLVRCIHDDQSWESTGMSSVSSVNKKDAYVTAYNVRGKKTGKDVSEELKVFWDDGFGTQTFDDAIEIAMELSKSDGGPPRWFCPIVCGKPIKDSPILLYLPGIDGIGVGLVVHEKALGKIFHVQCLHIPIRDRTSLEGLIQIVEETVKIEHTLSPNKPIYLLGESFGGALALAIAARNPTVDLILILANPATSCERSPLRSLPYIVRDWPEEHYWMLFYAMSPLAGDYIKIAMIKNYDRNHLESLWQLLASFSKDLPLLSVMANILPKDTLVWRLNLVISAAAYANSRLHAITSQVLVLASGRDNVLPSKNEALRLFRLLKHCDVRVFEENGHTILLESGVNVLSAIKTTYMYRRSSKHDIVKDFLPASMTEYKSGVLETW